MLNKCIEEFCFNYLRSYEGSLVDNIIINLPNIDVNIHQSTSSKTEIKMHGKVSVVGGKVKGKACKVNRDIVIDLNYSGKLVNIDAFCNIYLPSKNFKILSINSDSSICIEERIYAGLLKATTTSGIIRSNATFKKAILKSESGTIEARFFAESDVEVNITSKSGDINVSISNVAKYLINTHSTLGAVRNYFKQSGSTYTAIGDITSSSGNILIN